MPTSSIEPPHRTHHFSLHELVRPGNGWRLLAAMSGVAMNAYSNHLQSTASGTTVAPGGVHGMLAAYGEDFWGVFAISAAMRICGLRPLVVVGSVVVAGAVWEALQALELLPGTADPAGDLLAYAAGAIAGITVDAIVRRVVRQRP